MISIVIPVYQNEGSIKVSYERIRNVLLNNGYKDYEFIFINDGSTDKSEIEVVDIQKNDKNVFLYQFTRNFGQVSAVIAGLKLANGDVAINISADLQDPPELIVKMLSEWKLGNKIVLCHRVNRDDGYLNNLTSNLFYKIINFLNSKIPKGGFDFCLMDREALNSFNRINERNRFFQGDIMWLGYSVKLIPYERLKRTIGKSKWTISKKIKYLIDGLVNTTYLPIRIFSVIGVIFSFIGFFYALLIVWNWLLHKTPFNGWAPIMILILLVGGLLMLMLGIIGEYIWRIYDEVRGRDIYILKQNEINE
jgi:glycosyltransferase involved in cell wall biosynthesis